MTITANKQIEFAGLRLDGRQAGGSYEIQSVEGLADGAELRSANKARVARNGLVAGYSYLGGRTVTLTVEVTNFDSATFHAAVAALREAFAVKPGSTEQAFTFQIPGIADGLTAQITARVNRFSMPLSHAYWADTATATIELVATDPLIYSAAETTTPLTLSAASSGMTFPITFPLTFGATGISGVTTVTNVGTAPSPPSFRIYGPVTNPTLRNETQDKAVTVGLVLGADEYVDIDVQDRTVVLNGNINRYSSLTVAQWWELEPGDNQIRYLATAGSGVTADMYWRSAFY